MPVSTPSASHPFTRLREAFAWRRDEWERGYRGWVIRNSAGGEAAIRRRWPWPLRRPWQLPALRLWSFGGGIGDELMCTPIFRAIKTANPQCRITFISRHPELFHGNPHLDEVEPMKAGERPAGLALTYGPVHPPPRPLVTMLGECVGLEIGAEDLEPLHLPATGRDLSARLAAATGPRIVVQPLASQWTPNKHWPVENWRELLIALSREFDVIEVGTAPLPGTVEFGPRFHSLAGATDLLGLAQVIGAAAVFVGPVSGGMHLANALRIPSVILYGGYEAPAGHAYSQTTGLYSEVPCAPCWLPGDCPHDRKCLRMITPEEVMEAVRARLRSGVRN